MAKRNKKPHNKKPRNTTMNKTLDKAFSIERMLIQMEQIEQMQHLPQNTDNRNIGDDDKFFITFNPKKLREIIHLLE